MAEMSRSEAEQRAYWNGRMCQHWGPEAAGSVPLGRQFNTWRYRVRRVVFRRLVRRLALPLGTLSVLDIGCGTGFYLEQWQALGVASMAGLDISDWAVKQLARTYPKAAFYRANIGGMDSPLPVQAFDVISAIDVLVHLVDDAAYMRAIENLRRSLKPGGYLLYSDAFFHGPDQQAGDYWRGRSLAAVTAAMDASGFEIVSRVPMSVLMSPPTDTRHRQRNERIWNMAMTPVLRHQWVGGLYGALLYPLELLLVCTLKESPAIELMVCRKRS
jgi:2-polyprenyl-3-methyl-5-hydroxy-6-metoxy-1,4-benzoquinol methylase